MNSLQGRRIALIGGAGFIGHHLALTLRRLGASVAVIDNLRVNNLLSYASAGCSSPNRELYLRMLSERLELLRRADVQLYTQDARNTRSMRSLIRQWKPAVVVHLAGVSHADKSNRSPHGAFQHTLSTLENTLDAVRGDLEHFIFFSSSMVYGHFPSGSVTETTPCEPVGIYGALKYAGERLVIAHHQVFQFPYTIVRPSALYGERCVSRRVAQIFIEAALKGESLEVAGDGSDRLDFTYIGDLVQGIVNILGHDASHNEIFNLTYGNSRSIQDLLEVLQESFGDLDVRHRPKPRLQPRRGTLCVEKARSLIGYEPRHPIDVGVKEYIRWYRELLGQQTTAERLVELKDPVSLTSPASS